MDNEIYMTYVRKSTPAELRAGKKYREQNRDAINERMRQYYQINKDQILYNKKVRYHDKRRLAVIESELQAMYANVVL